MYVCEQVEHKSVSRETYLHNLHVTTVAHCKTTTKT